MTAAATGNLSMIQLLLTHYKNEYKTLTEKHGSALLRSPPYGFEETKSAELKWTVIHALLTGCETEAMARKKVQYVEESEKNGSLEEKNVKGKSVENDATEVKLGMIMKENVKMKMERRKSILDSSPGLRCVGNVWLRIAMCGEGGEGGVSGVRRSKAARMREGSQALELLLRTVLSGNDKEGQESNAEEGQQRSSESDVFGHLFSAVELGASLLYQRIDTDKRNTRDLSGKGDI